MIQETVPRPTPPALTAPTCANAASRRSSRSAMSRDDLSQHPQHPAFPDGFITDPYCCVPPPDDLGDVDDRFVFDFRSYDDLEDGQCWSRLSVERLCRGPEPLPDWVATSQSAIDTELGVLKTGKEADVHLVERADPLDPAVGVVMAAKRYRSPGYRTFHRAASYTEGRSMKRSRDERAIKRKSEQAGVEAEVLGWLMCDRSGIGTPRSRSHSCHAKGARTRPRCWSGINGRQSWVRRTVGAGSRTWRRPRARSLKRSHGPNRWPWPATRGRAN